MAATGYVWHRFSDGAATYATDDGGWILVSNSEVADEGGASAIRFRANGAIASAYRILGGTNRNCSGGATPWGTWLSCEEVDDGLVWECDPWGREPPRALPALGVFKHEAACVDPESGHVYLTEDLEDGCLYRFTPATPGDLREGLLEVAEVASDAMVRWTAIPDPSARFIPTRSQVPGATAFRRAEGIWFDSGIVYIATTADSRILAYHTGAGRLTVVYSARTIANPTLTNVDSITVAASGDLYACEDHGGATRSDIGIITRPPRREAALFLKCPGRQHTRYSSELTGVVFNPAGDRMYFASQKAFGAGAVYEIRGPFR